tara:strand:+ start:213 stop:398 length:186 start_codon:yes stop_codon:yes gene_type:complete
MTKKMTKAQAIKDFRVLYKTFSHYRRGDVIAKQQEWGIFTDSLCKAGLITLKQYENWGQPF